MVGPRTNGYDAPNPRARRRPWCGKSGRFWVGHDVVASQNSNRKAVDVATHIVHTGTWPRSSSARPCGRRPMQAVRGRRWVAWWALMACQGLPLGMADSVPAWLVGMTLMVPLGSSTTAATSSSPPMPAERTA